MQTQLPSIPDQTARTHDLARRQAAVLRSAAIRDFWRGLASRMGIAAQALGGGASDAARLARTRWTRLVRLTRLAHLFSGV